MEMRISEFSPMKEPVLDLPFLKYKGTLSTFRGSPSLDRECQVKS